MEEAIKRIQEILKHPSDIEDKLDPFIVSTRRELTKRSISYKNKLNQILYNLNLNKERLDKIKIGSKEYENTFERNINLLESFEGYVQHYDKIKNIAIAHRNFQKVKELHEKLENLNVEIEKYESSVKIEDDEQENTKNVNVLCREHVSMISIHKKVFELEEFKYELFFYMENIERESFLNVQRKIIMIDKVILDFLLKFLAIGSNFLNDPMIRSNLIYLKEIETIIEIEESRDALTRKVKRGAKEDDSILTEIYNMHYWYSNRKESDYKIKFESAMRDCIRGRFDRLKMHKFTVGNLEIVYEDINTISFFIRENDEESNVDENSNAEKNTSIDITNKKEEISINSTQSNYKESDDNETQNTTEEKNMSNNESLSSSGKQNETEKISVVDWNDIILEYHRQLKLFLDERMFNNNETLFILEFINKYYILINTKLKIPKETLGEELLSERQDKIISDYVNTATSSLGVWIQTITNNEKEKFYDRLQPPILDEENKYISENFINLLSLIKQQLEPISLNKKIFTFIANDILKYCSVFSKEMIKIMEKDLLPSIRQKNNPGYEEYVIMMGNSGLKLTQYVSSLPQSQTDEVKDLGNIFLAITRESNRLLSQFVIYTCREVLDKIFTDQWYNEDVIKTLIITLEDFLMDYRTTMNEYMFHTFCFELIGEIRKSFLKQLMRKRAKIYEDCGYKLDKNIETLCKLFMDFIDEEGVKELFDVFKKISPLLGRSSVDIFVIELKTLLISFPDVKKEYIKNIVGKKDELNSAEKKVLLEKVKECFNDVKDARQTLFSSVKF